MSDEIKINTFYIPDYFIIKGKVIGKQDPSYNEMVTKYCKDTADSKDVKLRESEEAKHEQQNS